MPLFWTLNSDKNLHCRVKCSTQKVRCAQLDETQIDEGYVRT